MKITLKNNVVAEVKKGTTVYSLAENVSSSLAKNAVCGKVNGVLVDIFATINKNCKVEIISTKDTDAQIVLKRSASHILSQAVKSVYPNVRLVGGGISGDEFYYDFDFKTAFDLDNMSVIEEEFEKIVQADFPFVKSTISRDDAIVLVENQGETYKLEQLFENEGLETCTIYTDGDFFDISEGPFIRSTSMIKSFKLTRSEKIFWKNDKNNNLLTRIYGVAFFKPAELDRFLKKAEETNKNSHLRLGKELNLFYADNNFSNFVWLDGGISLYDSILSYLKQSYRKYGFNSFSSPIVSFANLEEKADMLKNDLGMAFAVNDKNKILINHNNFSKIVSMLNGVSKINDTLKIVSFDALVRNLIYETETSLFTTNFFHKDDSFVVVSKTNLNKELSNILDFAISFYKTFGLKYQVNYSQSESDINSQSILNVLNAKFGKNGYNKLTIADKNSKIEFLVKDIKGREWKTFELEIDKILAEKIGLVSEKCTNKALVVVNFSIAGKIERFMALLTEQKKGEFPFWLSPIQVGIICTKKNYEYAEKIYNLLTVFNMRAKIVYKTKDSESEFKKLKTPIIFTLGEREEKSKTISAKIRNDGGFECVDAQTVIEKLSYLNINKNSDFIKTFKGIK